MNAATLPALIQRFFTDRLCVQMEASRHTIAGYRDTFRLLLRFASVRHGKPLVKLSVEDIDADLVDFLVHGETARGNSARSRNTRLAAIRSFFRYVAMTDPTRLLHCQRVLAMPNKRYVKRAVTFLDAEEIAALLAAPDRTTWAGRRDHALLLLAIQTGLRASELGAQSLSRLPQSKPGSRAVRLRDAPCSSWPSLPKPLHMRSTARTVHDAVGAGSPGATARSS